MQAIAEERGYATNILLTQSATRTAVLGSIQQAAAELRDGDIFLLTYSGHGGQLPDFNSDEQDAVDETWCLYDGQLIDEELYMLWTRFQAGVRILVLSDSCHSGTVIRAMPDGGFADETMACAPNRPATWPRSMPRQVAARVFRQNRQFYTNIGKSLDAVESAILTKVLACPLHCTVQLIPGCQDNQPSMDGPFPGASTGRLLEVWDEGRFKGTYAQFHAAILQGMPSTQSPNHWIIGRPNSVFLNQKPFEI